MSRNNAQRLLGGLRLAGLLLLVAVAPSCRQDMHDQRKYEPLEPSTFFEDGRGSRPPVEGTVARGFLREDAQFFTGKEDGARQAGGAGVTGGGSTGLTTSTDANRSSAVTAEYQGFVPAFPMPVTEEILDRGEERFNIFCSVCHSRTGDGNGMVVRRGYRKPPSLHEDRLRQAPVGYFFDVITNGFGAMPDYSAQITARDRWAIIAYIRALQRAHQGTLADVPEDQRGRLNSGSQRQEGNQK